VVVLWYLVDRQTGDETFMATKLQVPTQGIATYRTESVLEDQVMRFGGRPEELIGTGFTYRHDWGNLNNQNILNLQWGAINRNSRVFVAIGEGDANGGKVIGAARYTLYNVAPNDGVISIWVNIEWSYPIRLYVDYFVVNPS
jgi:hypothetical protein